jgi:protein transport protein SEC9
MARFGFGKKSDDKKDSPAPQADNPYAQQPPANDPYAEDSAKYANMPAQGRAGGLPSGPRARGGGGGLPAGPGARKTPSNYDSPSNGSGYGSDKLGASGGYGANRYEEKSGGGYGGGGAGSRGAGGYGGLGRTNSEMDDNRDALFSGAKDRATQRQGGDAPQQNAYSQSGSYGDYGNSGRGNDADSNRDALFSGAGDRYAQRQANGGGGRYGPSGASSGAYGDYGSQRELTEEEREQQEIADTKAEIQAVKDQSVNTSSAALRRALEAEETARATLARLGAQGERLHNTERNLDLAANHNKVAEDRAKELKTLNRSMFAVHVGNPFTSKSRQTARDQAVMDRHRSERDQREATRQAAAVSQQRMEESFKDLSMSGQQSGRYERSAAEKAKYSFVDDDDDDEYRDEDERKEQEIERNITLMGGAVGNLNKLARAIGREVDEQNVLIDRIGQKVRIFLLIHF